eukprot:TRINITY_DN1938_c0_g1_i1.p1 TRINITY_DN1938_c0_g1~~TRINITY_DN1938_c0_g1_i1.p1  ORF type:complete len:679 (+),score=247.42 TRINITY_DN1938_c0_g1_i1:48-2039(+)
MKDTMSPKGMKSVTNSIAVMIRCRPFNTREKEWFISHNKEMTPVITMDDNTVTVLDPNNDYTPKDAYSYHNCYWSCVGFDSPNGIAGQEDIYETTGKVLLEQALEGYNGCVFAYGQTGSGKTYSMLGGHGQPGVSYLLIRDLFKHIEEESVANPGAKYTVHISFMEIYNEQVRDLFNKKVKQGEYSPVKIRQHPVFGITVDGLIKETVTSAESCEKQMERGVSERALAETKMNATSSRSHAICQITIEQVNATTGLRRNSSINLVDLAGSERLKMTGVSGAQLTEAKNINQSLSTLRKVFDVLIENSKKKQKAVPPYRESMLTWVLKESLGGNSRTMMIAAVSPCEESIEDTVSTLRYAQKAKAIVCKVIQNEQPNAKMVSNLKGQVEDLKKQLEEQLKNGTLVDKEAIRQEYAEQIQATEAALKDAEATEMELKVVQAQLEKEKKELEEDKKQIQIEMDSAKKQKFTAAFRSAFVIKKDKSELKSLKVALAKMTDARSIAEKESAGLKRDLEDVRGKYLHLQKTYHDEVDKRVRVEDELDAQCSEARRLSDELARAQKEADNWKRRYRDLEMDYDDVRTKARELEKRNETYERFQKNDKTLSAVLGVKESPIYTSPKRQYGSPQNHDLQPDSPSTPDQPSSAIINMARCDRLGLKIDGSPRR